MRKYFLAFVLVVIIISCGHKQNPTGGKKDTVQPEILSVLPDEYSDITGKKIEVIFSKAIERNTIITGLYIYPPILQKKYSWNGNILTIKILEDLADNTNYYFSFSDNIKDEHGNFLNKNSIFVFSSGKLNSNRISGSIIFEDIADENKPIQLTLSAADSTKIYTRELFGEKYIIDDLNKNDHIISAFIDKNNNQKYNLETEPYFQQYVTTANSSLVDIELAYVDTIKPKLESIKVNWNNSIDMKFNESLLSFNKVMINTSDSLESKVKIIAQYFNQDMLSLLVDDLDTLKYKVTVTNLSDKKQNVNSSSSLMFNGITLRDTIPPKVISTKPRTGSSVNTLTPVISVLFSEIILEDNIEVKLVETETGKYNECLVLNANSRNYNFSPKQKLKNYSSYLFELKAKDNSGNISLAAVEIIFLPLQQSEREEAK
ncbi:MAG: Ig-like domain-containing protein [Candidatus Cloacimonetes bacterium]|nr:Ig-like domain-containing protein [Candidatus Cloacimonadota bacterium]